eukprot:1480173-Prymnesium_polylepis.1
MARPALGRARRRTTGACLRRAASSCPGTAPSTRRAQSGAAPPVPTRRCEADGAGTRWRC